MSKYTDIMWAIQYLPEELFTQEIVNAGIAKGGLKMLEYLPQAFNTKENIEKIFQSVDSSHAEFDLQTIPEEYRTQSMYEIAVKRKPENYVLVPDEFKTEAMLLDISKSFKNHLSLLPHIPPQTWTTQAVCKAINSINENDRDNRWYFRKKQYSGYYSSGKNRNTDNPIKIAQVILSYMPGTLKNAELYCSLVKDTTLSGEALDFLTPNEYKNDEYHLLMAAKDINLVPDELITSEILLQALENGANITVSDLFEKETHNNELFSKIIDDKLADYIVEQSASYFKKLPADYQTAGRLLFTMQKHTDYNHYESLVKGSPHLLTEDVCKQLIKLQTALPELPKEIWTEDFVDYCLKVSDGYYWFHQMPKQLQTQEIVDRVCKKHGCHIQYAQSRYVNSLLAMELYRSNNRVKQYLPEKYFEDFEDITGLPVEFYGGEKSFWDVKNNKGSYTYCKIGNTYIGLYKDDGYRSSSFYVIMTRTLSMASRPEQVFERRVMTFHKSWLEKMIADYDFEYIKPTIGKGLKQYQENIYLGVRKYENENGYNIYCNTFNDIPVLYSANVDGNIVFRETIEEIQDELLVTVQEEMIA